jgi:hypothetical protein
MAKAKALLDTAITNIGLRPNDPFESLYQHQALIRQALATMNASAKIAVSTTGAITEMVCEWGLKIAVPDGYSRLGRNEKWMGDFSILGYPLNALISVKSFKAKERLMASGLGSLLVPTIGFGWFNEPSEFGPARCRSYRDKGFAVIYMPRETLDNLTPTAINFKNANQRPLLRDVQSMPDDLTLAIKHISYGTHRLPAICTSLL